MHCRPSGAGDVRSWLVLVCTLDAVIGNHRHRSSNIFIDFGTNARLHTTLVSMRIIILLYRIGIPGQMDSNLIFAVSPLGNPPTWDTVDFYSWFDF